MRTSASRLSSSMKIPSQSRYGVTVSTYGKLDSMSSRNYSPPRYTDVSFTTFIMLPHSSVTSRPASPPVSVSACRMRDGL